MHFYYQLTVFALLRLLLHHPVAASLYEHVILADCTAPSTIRISHMAYYPEGLTVKPASVAVVPSARSQTAVWIRNGSSPLSATFADGIVFTANLSATYNQGDFAGYGSNSWGTMSCWRFQIDSIYVWFNDVRCNAVYDCNRQEAMGDSPNAPRPTDENGDDGDAKRSNNIALGVGLGIGIPSLVATVMGMLFAWRKRKSAANLRP